MSTQESVVPELPAAPMARTLLDRFARRAILRLLGMLQEGEIVLQEGTQSGRFRGDSVEEGLSSTLRVSDSRFYRAVLLGGSTGAARAYMNGWWQSGDLTALIRIVARHRHLMDHMDAGWVRLTKPAQALWSFTRRNTRKGSRRNIHAHYDLSNDFFTLFLDPTMTYSCGIFEKPDSTMEDASIAKIDRACRKLSLGPEDHLLEIGSGWGALAIHAARHYGCRVTTTTISREQFDMARRHVADARLHDRIDVRLEDYRDIRGTYDKLVSIEMIEAVGWKYLDGFFNRCGALLKPEGMMLLQAITMEDQRHETSKRTVDFIKRYIFPGGCVVSVTAMLQSMTRASDLRLFHLEDITQHYVKTLRLWREQFMSHLGAVHELGFPESFARMWEFYLSYCEGAFSERLIGDVQMLLTKPLCHRPPILVPRDAIAAMP